MTVSSRKPAVSCSRCDAVCCRLTVVLMPGDDVPPHMVEHSESGPDVMARSEDGWCVAVDRDRMCCSIYSQRPAICRKFAMGSAYCREEREAYRQRNERTIPLELAPD
ncbi:YkgJ family cysteine cluster protein [Marilutibacter alkalisoli]|uniref:YkgJ family cysteine cluster protein n=1 Tax=Marilutibacter alkalisoli TaxID=2591633 RepID=A0A514BSK2_9GAMM|nr:YkgJ family cysteine cluster protein [Lysobacter alkalisoli]QDH70295.1 YkgJ family cysteine cluster protein [Lysobacter alkalisoli]